MIPSSPPAEVLDAMSVAAGSYDRLADQGHALHFRIDDTTGWVIVELRDVHGKLRFTVPPSRALEVADHGAVWY